MKLWWVIFACRCVFEISPLFFLTSWIFKRVIWSLSFKLNSLSDKKWWKFLLRLNVVLLLVLVQSNIVFILFFFLGFFLLHSLYNCINLFGIVFGDTLRLYYSHRSWRWIIFWGICWKCFLVRSTTMAILGCWRAFFFACYNVICSYCSSQKSK